MTTLLISGLGLIGSSLARMIRQSPVQATIIGTDPNQSEVTFMLAHELIDQALPFTEAAPQADVIILAGPVDVIEQQLGQLTTLSLKETVLVTDVGSTKSSVMAAAQPLMQRGISFVGGHPMAGSHETGSAAGNIERFKHAIYFLVDGNATTEQLKRIKQLLAPAQFNWQPLSAAKHDQLVSVTSDLPHVVASALMNAATSQLTAHELKTTAGGFRDTTRIAAADPTMWTLVLMTNQQAVIEQLTAFENELTTLKQAVANGDETAIHQFFEQAQTAREQLN